EEPLLAEPPEKEKPAPAGLRRAAVLRDGHDRHQLHVLVELALGEPGLAAAERVKVFADAFLADVDAVEPDLDRAVLREEVGGLVPETEVDVVAECTLKTLYRVQVLEALLAPFERLDAALELCDTGIVGGRDARVGSGGIPAACDGDDERGGDET